MGLEPNTYPGPLRVRHGKQGLVGTRIQKSQTPTIQQTQHQPEPSDINHTRPEQSQDVFLNRRVRTPLEVAWYTNGVAVATERARTVQHLPENNNWIREVAQTKVVELLRVVKLLPAALITDYVHRC